MDEGLPWHWLEHEFWLWYFNGYYHGINILWYFLFTSKFLLEKWQMFYCLFFLINNSRGNKTTVKCVFQGLSIYFIHACFLFIKVYMTSWILISKYLELNKYISMYNVSTQSHTWLKIKKKIRDFNILWWLIWSLRPWSALTLKNLLIKQR